MTATAATTSAVLALRACISPIASPRRAETSRRAQSVGEHPQVNGVAVALRGLVVDAVARDAHLGVEGAADPAQPERDHQRLAQRGGPGVTLERPQVGVCEGGDVLRSL